MPCQSGVWSKQGAAGTTVTYCDSAVNPNFVFVGKANGSHLITGTVLSGNLASLVAGTSNPSLRCGTVAGIGNLCFVTDYYYPAYANC